MSVSHTFLSIVVAASRKGVIGFDGGMPWHVPSDLRRFRSITMGKPIVMGRKTFDSIGRPLRGRISIVVSRQPRQDTEAVLHAVGIDEAIAMAQRLTPHDLGEACIVGGGEIYRQCLHAARRVHLTTVEADIDGDTVFPELDRGEWKVVLEEDGTIEGDSHPTTYRVFERL